MKARARRILMGVDYGSAYGRIALARVALAVGVRPTLALLANFCTSALT